MVTIILACSHPTRQGTDVGCLNFLGQVLLETFDAANVFVKSWVYFDNAGHIATWLYGPLTDGACGSVEQSLQAEARENGPHEIHFALRLKTTNSAARVLKHEPFVCF